jgi:hypothetical protein
VLSPGCAIPHRDRPNVLGPVRGRSCWPASSASAGPRPAGVRRRPGRADGRAARHGRRVRPVRAGVAAVRWTTGLCPLLPVPAFLIAVTFLDDIHTLGTPRGAWMTLLLSSHLAVLTIACAIPRRAPEVVPQPEAPDAGDPRKPRNRQRAGRSRSGRLTSHSADALPAKGRRRRVIILYAKPPREPLGSKALVQPRDALDAWPAIGAGERIAAEG